VVELVGMNYAIDVTNFFNGYVMRPFPMKLLKSTPVSVSDEIKYIENCIKMFKEILKWYELRLISLLARKEKEDGMVNK